MEEKQRTEAGAVSQKKKFKLDKKVLSGFAAGFVMAAILFSGVVFGLNPELLQGTTTNLNAKQLSEYTDYWHGSFEVNSLYDKYDNYNAVLSKSDRARVSFLTPSKTPAFEQLCIELNLRYGNYLHAMIFTGINAEEKSRLVIGTSGANVLKQMDITTEITFAQVEEFINGSGMPWTFHDTTLYGRPVYYTMFQNLPATQGLGIDPYDYYSYLDWDTLGNIRLLSGRMIPSNYEKCDGSAYAGANLTDLFGAGNLPNLISPDSNIAYYMCNDGKAATANYSAEDIADGELSYHAQFEKTYDLYIGELVLVSNLDKSLIGGNMVLCDGRSLKTNDYQVLLAVIGFQYGFSNGYNYFNIPNLVGQSPLPGADYYIVYNGIFPYRP